MGFSLSSLNPMNAAKDTFNLIKNPTGPHALQQLMDPGSFAGNNLWSPWGPSNQGGGNTSGAPAYPGYAPAYDNSMAVGLNSAGQKALLDQGLRSGPSQWANLSTAQQNKEETQARDRAAFDAAGATAGAQAGLASSGGLTSGGRERTQEAGQKGFINASQDAARQAGLNRMQIGINDESNRLQNLGTAANMEQQNALANQNAQLQSNMGKNAYNLGLYNTQGQIYAGNQMANATQKSGGSFLCTELNKRGLTTKDEAKVMRGLMMRGLLKRADYAVWYYKYAQKAVKVLNKQGFDWSSVKKDLVSDVLLTMAMQGDDAAQDLYIMNSVDIICDALPEVARRRFTKRVQSFFYLPVLLMKKEVLGWLWSDLRRAF